LGHLDAYFEDVTDKVRQGLGILVARHHAALASLEEELRTAERRLKQAEGDNEVLRARLAECQLIVSKVNALTAGPTRQKLGWWQGKLDWFLQQQEAVGGYKDTTLSNTKQYVKGWLTFLAKAGERRGDDPDCEHPTSALLQQYFDQKGGAISSANRVAKTIIHFTKVVLPGIDLSYRSPVQDKKPKARYEVPADVLEAVKNALKADIEGGLRTLGPGQDEAGRKLVRITALFFVTVTGARPIEGSWVAANPHSVEPRPANATGYWQHKTLKGCQYKVVMPREWTKTDYTY